MRTNTVELLQGSLESISVPGQNGASPPQRENQLAVRPDGGMFIGKDDGTGNLGWEFLPSTATPDKVIASNLLGKLRHWWPLDSIYDQQFSQDIHGGADLRQYVGSDVKIVSSLRPGGTNASAFTENTSCGFFVHGKPSWMSDRNISSTSWARLDGQGSSPTAPVRPHWIITDSPQGDGDASFNLTYIWGVSGGVNPQCQSLQWEYGTGEGNGTVDPEYRVYPHETYFVGAARDAENRTVKHYNNAVPSTPVPYEFNPEGGTGPLCKLSVGQYAFTQRTDPSDMRPFTTPFYGALQDVALWHGVLDDEEMAFLYNGGQGRALADLYAVAERPYLWTPSLLKRKVLWVQGDHVDNARADGGFVDRIENLAGFMPGVPVGGLPANRFRDDLDTLNGRRVLTSTNLVDNAGQVVFPHTNFARFLGISGCTIFAVSKATIAQAAQLSVEVSVVVPAKTSSGRLLDLKRVATGELSVGGRRLSTNSYASGPSSASAQWGWSIACSYNDYSTGNSGLRVNGGSDLTRQIFSVGTTSTSDNPYTGIGLGANSYDNNSKNANSTFAEVIVMDALATVEERQKVEGYLAHAWGLTSLLSSGHPYKTSPPLA